MHPLRRPRPVGEGSAFDRETVGLRQFSRLQRASGARRLGVSSRYVGPADGDGGRAPERGDRAEPQAEPVTTTTVLSTELVEETVAALLKPLVVMLPSIKP